jgi:hypothetical protein
MSVEYFNSYGGFSVGIPPVPVADANGNIVTNVLTTGNVAANVVYGNSFRFANGAPLTVVAAGSNTQLQFNSNGAFAASSALTFNSTTQLLSTGNLTVIGNTNLGNASTVKIQGGVDGYFLQTDGTGNLSWAVAGGGGNGSPGGSNTQVQFNDAGTFGAEIGFTYDKVTNLLTVGNVSTTNITTPTANVTTLTVTLANATTANIANLNVSGIANLANANVTGTVIAGNVSAANITITGNSVVSSTGTLRVQGNVNFSPASNVTLGDISKVHIDGGVNGYILSTDGTGNLAWIVGGGGGGNGSPGGSNTQIQYNKYGAFAGSPFFTFNDATETVQVAGTMVANTVQVGSGVYKYASTTSSISGTTTLTPNQVIYSTPAANIAGIEFDIIATNQTLNIRNTMKISSQIYGTTILFNETGGLYYNGSVGDFDITYNAGNLITPSSIELKVSPTNLNQTTYKMLVTTLVS